MKQLRIRGQLLTTAWRAITGDGASGLRTARVTSKPTAYLLLTAKVQSSSMFSAVVVFVAQHLGGTLAENEAHDSTFSVQRSGDLCRQHHRLLPTQNRDDIPSTMPTVELLVIYRTSRATWCVGLELACRTSFQSRCGETASQFDFGLCKVHSSLPLYFSSVPVLDADMHSHCRV